MSATTDSRLAAVAERVERMALDPESVTASWTLRLSRPFYRWLGWQPELSVVRIRGLLAELARLYEGQLDDCQDELEQALEELESNVAVAERACVVNGALPVAQIAWLGRLTRVLAQAAQALDGDMQQPAVLAAAFDAVLVMPPLSVARASADTTASDTRGVEEAASERAVAENKRRVVELELAAIDHIIEAARAESGLLERRRRLLEAARRLLLDADAALELDAEGVRLRKRYLTAQIVHADRLQACGLAPHTALLHQAQTALARGDRGRLYAALVAMEGYATTAGDLRGGSLARRALGALDGSEQGEARRQHSIARSVADVMGDEVIDSVHRAYAAARRGLEAKRRATDDDEIYQLAVDYLAPGAEAATLSSLLSVDGCFDVGAPLAPVRVRETRVVARVVSHPTQDLILTPATGPEDLVHAIIGDPRGLLLDLAAGRLLARKFVRYEERSVERIEMTGEVRVYLLDGSTSMLEAPARARMRDAILTAELATLMARFDRPEEYTRVLMFYRYFTKRTGPLQRVSDAAEALGAIGDVLSRQRTGGTNIERALVTSFEMIRDARAADSDLGRAQVVLITDGEATITEQVVQDAREQVGRIPVAVSVIALGQQNVALRRLVARQRQRGERAFYHFIDDETLIELAEGNLGGSRALHLVDEDETRLTASELETAVGGVLDEAAALERTRHHLLLSPASSELEAAFAEVGLLPSMMSDGRRALHEAAAHDRRALELRFRKWFPTPAEKTRDTVVAAGDDEEAALVVLATVAEVVSELGADELERKADAVDVLERLLPDARLSPARYDVLVRAPSQRLGDALRAVHEVTAPARSGS